MSENGIAYQNKDIASKVFAEKFRDVSLNVYGVDLPKIVEVLPTDFPEISASELRIDDLFLLEDGRIAIIDYESDYKKENHLKYLGYAYRVLERYFSEGNPDIKLVMIVIYTADVTRSKVKNSFSAGMVNVKEEAAFLSELKSEEIKKRLNEKISAGEDLTDEEIMEFIILPLSYKKKDQGKAIEDAINLAKEIKDQDTMVFVLSGILVFTDKVIDKELSEKTKGWMKMTKVGRLFLEEAEQMAEQREQRADAKRLVGLVDALAQTEAISIEEACIKMKITLDDYENAKGLINSTEVMA
ncbi:MAG: hypothetical protein IJ857_09140 [Lachnospiraceae bacterium]|nr:hypothetical protein [Lachnospiraceae bacterium]